MKHQPIIGDLFGGTDAPIPVELPPDRWRRLIELVRRPTGKHDSGGYQDRLARWRSTMDHRKRMVPLTVRRAGRALDDVTWIRHQIANQHGGGWQASVAAIFTGAHESFADVAIAPRAARKRGEMTP